MRDYHLHRKHKVCLVVNSENQMGKCGRPSKNKATCKDLASKHSEIWCKHCKGKGKSSGCKPTKAVQEFYSNAAHTLPIIGPPPPEPESKAPFKRGEVKQRAMDKICCFIINHARDQQQPETKTRSMRTCTTEGYVPSSVDARRFTFEPEQVRSSLIYRPAIEGTDQPIVGSHASIKRKLTPVTSQIVQMEMRKETATSVIPDVMDLENNQPRYLRSTLVWCKLFYAFAAELTRLLRSLTRKVQLWLL